MHLAASSCMAAGLLLTGCADTLVYGERTRFDLSIGVNESIALPINVNAGFHRSAAGLVPAREGLEQQNGETIAKGEAASMLSGFRLNYAEDDASIFGGELTIQSQFASGKAAATVAEKPAVAALIVQPPALKPVSMNLQNRQVAARHFLADKIIADPGNLIRLARSLDLDAPDARTAFDNVSTRIATSDEDGFVPINAAIARIFGRDF